MPTNRVRIIVQGSSVDAGHVRLSDFLDQMEAVRNALKQTERLLREGLPSALYYRIVGVSHRSPLTITLEGATHEPNLPPGPVVQNFLATASQIRRRGVIPEGFDYAAAEAYRAMVAPQRKHVTSLIVANGRRRVRIDEQYEKKILAAIGPDEYAEGSIAGTLDTVKLHNTTAFEIFPTIGPKKVSCHFPAASTDLREKVKRGLESYVRVYGRLRYKHWDKFPYAIDAHDLDVYPPDQELPTLTELRGIAPDLTGGLTEHDFLEKVRNAWEA
jgi:hypothetical protein